MFFQKTLLSRTMIVTSSLLAPFIVQAEENALQGESLTVFGILPDRLEAVPGSFQIIDSDYLETRRPVSVKEMLHTVPGLNVVPDGSMSHDLNIGIRGLNPRRSTKAMIMEDGMPLQLAPYADPVNHYSPAISVLDHIEVIKGAGQILYGPQTLGGAVNFVTKAVPRNGRVEGSVTSAFGNQDYRLLNGNIGFGNEIGGVMFDFTQRKGENLYRGAENDIKDYRFKGELDITDRQSLMVKYTYVDDDRNQTEDYLTRDEYAQDKYRHPTARHDRFEQERHTVQLRHVFNVREDFKLTTQAYYSDISRRSVRTSRVGNVAPDSQGNLVSTYQLCNGIRRGLAVTAIDASQCGGRVSPRNYYNWGVETKADLSHSLFGLENDAIVGVRYHEDSAVLKYSWANSQAHVKDFGASWAANWGNRNEHGTLRAKGISYYAQNTTYLGDWAITPGFRVESLRSSYDDNLNDTRETRKQTEFLPSFGISWFGIPNSTIFAGVHKGISPARANREDIGLNAKPELATLYEVGFRSNLYKGVYVETTLFHANSKDTLANDDGEFFNVGKSERTGIEIASRANFGEIYNTVNNFYVSGAITHTPQAKYREDNLKGNRQEYAPRNLVNLDFGYQHVAGWDARIGVQHVGTQMPDAENRRVEDASGRRGLIPSYTIWNAGVNYRVANSGVTLFASVENLFDKEYLVSRRSGKLAGRDRLFFGGITYDF